MKTTNTTTIELTRDEVKDLIVAKFTKEHPNKKITVYFHVTGENDPHDYFSERALDYILSKVTVTIE